MLADVPISICWYFAFSCSCFTCKLFFKAVSIAALSVIGVCALDAWPIIVSRKMDSTMVISLLITVLNPFSNMMYKTGNTNKVRKVAISRPPITTVAKGLCTSAPAPLLIAMGKNPSEATNAVTSTGLSLTLVPIKTIRFKSVIPSFFNWLNSEINTMPLRTATPNKAIKPTPALILNGMPRRARNRIPPIADKGIAE